MIPSASSRPYWENCATGLARRINLAAWLARLAPVAFFVATVFAIAFYALRRIEMPLGQAWLALAAAFACVAFGCWWRARPSFFSPADARVLLESQQRLDNRLTAASLGLVGWPAAPGARPAVLRWQLGAPAGWIGGSICLLALAVLAPVPRESAATRPAGSPPALLQTQSMLEALQEMKIADEQSLEQLAERARELARRPADQQFSHSALEAADALRNQTAVAAANLGRGLDAAANALSSASDADMKSAAGQLAAALSGLRDGALPANQSLLGNLPLSEADLKNLSAEQRAQLAQQLASAAGRVNGIAGAAGAGARVPRPDPNSPGGRGRGAGGPGGGGGHAPLALASDPSNVGDGKLQGLTGEALKRFSLGDKLGTTAGLHDADPANAAGPMSAGAVAAPAAGGEAVWVNRLTPAERAALKNFFK